MPDFRVVPFRAEHLADMQALWRHLYSESEIEQRSRIFDWFALGNPWASPETPAYYMLLDGERVIGFHGHGPWPWCFGGRRVQAFMAWDDMLSPEYRGQGLGKTMLQGVAELRPEFVGGLWHNEPNHRLYQKAGWSDFDDFFPWLKVFDPTPLLRARLGPAAPLVGALGRGALALREALRGRPERQGLRFETIERFGADFDELFERVAPRFDAIVVRDATYLNWRFVDKPFGRYQRIAARDAEGRLEGYVVYRRRALEGGGHYGMIFDFLADPEGGAFGALIDEAVRRLREEGVGDVRIACTDPRFTRALEAQGFLRARRSLHYMVHHWEGVVAPEWMTSTRHWYLTYSDGDGDVWTTD